MRIALDQCRPATAGLDVALSRLDEQAARAASEGAALLMTPEMALTGYCIGAAAVRAAAEPLTGPVVQALAAMARRHRLALLVGLPELAGDGLIYNTVVLLDARGDLLGTARKAQLFGDVDRTQFAAASSLCAPFEFNGWRVALAICYDIEFPELARAHALAGAEAILVPTANMFPFESIPRRVVPTRAEENGVYVAYANYCGSEGDFDYCGLSCICGPDGEDVARAAHEETLLFGDLSKRRLADVREQIGYLRDRRADLYSAGGGPGVAQ
jgi:predicted amidohydrolase